MKQTIKIAILGGLVGALAAIVIVFGAALLGYFPQAASGPAIRAYLLEHPQVLAEANTRLQDIYEREMADKQAEKVAQKGLESFFAAPLAFSVGPKDAKYSVVEFFDYNCPYCRASNQAMKQFYDRHRNDTRIAFIEFPIKGAESTRAARVAIAARQQPDKYPAFHFALMNEKELVDDAVLYRVAQEQGFDMQKLRADAQSPAVDQAIAAAHAMAQDIGIDGTPTFIVNGRVYPGAVNEAELEKLIKS